MDAPQLIAVLVCAFGIGVIIGQATAKPTVINIVTQHVDDDDDDEVTAVSPAPVDHITLHRN